MKTKLRPRYYCDFCRKRGGSKHHMSKHEASCTMNPNRVCRMCRMMELEQRPMPELLALLPEYGVFDKTTEDFGTFLIDSANAVHRAMPALREAVSDCPACILAALRQKGIPVPMVAGFDFTKECRAWWAEINEEHLEECNYGY